MDPAIQKKFNFIINSLFYLLIIGIGYFLIKYVLDWIFPFVAAFIIVAIVHPIVKRIHSKIKINQNVISIIILILLYLLIGSLIIWLIFSLISLLGDMFAKLPEYYQTTLSPVLNDSFNGLENWLNSLSENYIIDWDAIQGTLSTNVQNFIISASQKGISFISGLTTRIPDFFVSLIFTIMLSFFISTQYTKILDFFKRQISEKTYSTFIEIKSILKSTVFKYIKAYLIIMVITFIELTIGLAIIGTKNSLLIAAGIALLDALPVFGTGLVMIPWIIIEFIQGNFAYGLGLLIVYGIITLVRNIIEPKIVGDQLGLNPIVSLLAIYLGYKIIGVLGMILFPIIIQTLLVLHNSGKITLYKRKFV